MLVISAGRFQVAVSSSCPGSYLADMELQLWCEEYTFQHGFQLLVGQYGFSDDMESGETKWTHGGTGDRWHRTAYRHNSGANSWYCGDESNRRYYDNTNAWLLSTPFMAPENCSLSFWRWFSVPNYGVDGIYAIVVRAGGADTLDFIGTGGALEGKSKVRVPKADVRSLEPLNPRTPDPSLLGIESDWYEERYALDWLAPGETVQVKIAFKSDGDGDYGEGFYIDDVAVSGGNPPPVFVLEPEPKFAGAFRIAVRPSPFTSNVWLQVLAAGSGRVSGAVYDAGGRKVCDFSSASRNGRAVWSWDGADMSGHRVAAGTYFVKVNSKSGSGLARVVKLD